MTLMMLVLMMDGCWGWGTGRDRDRGGSAPPGGGAPPPLHLRLEAPTRVRSGEPVTVRLVLANRGDRPIEVELGGSPIAFDIALAASDGSEVWRRLEGVAVPAVLQPRTLGPGEEMELADVWRQRDGRGERVRPGMYYVRGVLPVAGVAGGWRTDVHMLTILP